MQRGGELHAVLFPYPLQGHINPLLAVATSLAKASSPMLVTFVHTASNFACLLSHQLASASQSSIRLEPIPDHIPHDSPPPPDPAYAHSMRHLEAGLDDLLQRLANELHPVSCLISDILMPWTLDLARKFGIPRVAFCCFPALSYSIAHHVPDLITKGYLPFESGTEGKIVDSIPGLPPLHVADIPLDFLIHDMSHLEVIIRLCSRVNESAGLLVNSIYELEGTVLDLIHSELQIPVYPIGPLLPAADASSGGWSRSSPTSNLLSEDAECLKWLDDQADSSVIYVSFGSLASHSVDDIQELAFGLEASEQHFLWVIRHNSVKGAVSEVLPDGFMSRTKDRGLIISWAPQLLVLSHPSVGGFLTHCGWNSVLESLWMAVPMIGCPQLSDHSTVLKLMIDWKVGWGVEGLGRGITRGGVATAIRALILGEEGKEARKRAMELRHTLRKALTNEARVSLQEFVEDMKNLNCKTHEK